MITTTVAQLVNTTDAIKNVLGAKLPVKTAYQLAKIGKAIFKELEIYEEQRQKLCAEFGTLSKDGTKYEFNGEAAKEFQKQYQELLNLEVKIDLTPIKSVEFGDKAEVSASDLIACECFIVE